MKTAPPLVIFKGQNVWSNWIPEQEVIPNMTYAASPKGWIISEIFYNYLQKSLIPAIGDKKSCLVIYDGHATHVTPKVIEFVNRHGITILKLPAHTSHLLQPLDLSVFKPLKDKWDMKLWVWQRKHSGNRILKKEFAVLLAETWKNIKLETIINGFRKAGITPFNRFVIPDEKFDSEALKRWKIEKGLVEVEATTDSTHRISFEVVLLDTLKNNRQ